MIKIDRNNPPELKPGLYSLYLYYFWGCELTQNKDVISVRRPDLKYTYDQFILGKSKWLDYE